MSRPWILGLQVMISQFRWILDRAWPAGPKCESSILQTSIQHSIWSSKPSKLQRSVKTPDGFFVSPLPRLWSKLMAFWNPKTLKEGRKRKMGRPEPCVLFAQSFIHPHLNEYVDEVKSPFSSSPSFSLETLKSLLLFLFIFCLISFHVCIFDFSMCIGLQLLGSDFWVGNSVESL